MKAPILLIAFNRPHAVEKVFNAIRASKPENVCVAVDGPRAWESDDITKCERVREIVMRVDEGTRLHTRFRDVNLGCGMGPVDAINWFFSKFEEGIILEDDCLPTQDFFAFCEEMLQKYRNENSIYQISGFNPVRRSQRRSYVFTRYAGIWGWATWRRAWAQYDFGVREWKNDVIRESVLTRLSKEEANILTHGIEDVISGRIAAWDYQWAFCRLLNDGLGIVPSKNLISNIGFGHEATHTKNHNAFQSKIQPESLRFPLRHPKIIDIDKEYEADFRSLMICSDDRIMSKLSRIIRRARARLDL